MDLRSYLQAQQEKGKADIAAGKVPLNKVSSWSPQRYQEKLAQYQTKNVLNNIYGQQFGLAKQFRENLPQYTQAVKDQALGDIQRNLAETMSKNKANAASRGMLGSGEYQKKKAEAQMGSAIESASKSSELENQMKDQADLLENQAYMTGLGIQAQDMQSQQMIMQQAISNMQAANDMWRSLGSAAGMIGGSYFASKNK